MRLASALVVCLASLPAQQAVDVGSLTAAQKRAIRAHLEKHASAPVEYLQKKLGEHDVVVLGEIHQVRETCELVANSLQPLYAKAALRCLASEFVRTTDTARINALVTAKKWDEAAVLAVVRTGPWPTWGFREYVDILKAAWRLNASLKPDQPKLRIQGIDSDWSQYDLWFTIADRTKRFQDLMAREANMVSSLVDGPIKAKQKTLVHVGYAHSVTCHGIRLATQLRKKYGQRVFQVAVHHEFGSRKKRAPMSVFLETEYAALDRGALGFDVVGTPLGRLKDGKSQFAMRMPKATFGQWAEGYVLLAPIAKQRSVRWIPGFIDGTLFEKANRVATRLRWVKKGECKDAKELDAKLAKKFGT